MGRCAGLARYAFDTAWDTLESVELPKYVVIKNMRLGIVLNILRLAAVAFLFWMILGNRSYLRLLKPKGYVTMWVSSADAAYQDAVEADLASELCTHPRKFDYKYDDAWVYGNYTCVTKTGRERIGWKEGPNMLYVPMSYEESRWERRSVLTPGAEGETMAERCLTLQATTPCQTGWVAVDLAGAHHDTPVCECQSVRSYIVAGVPSLLLDMEHYFEFAGAEIALSKTARSSQASAVSCATGGRWRCESQVSQDQQSKAELMTVMVVGRPGNMKVVLKKLAPSRIHVPLRTLIEAAGLDLNGFNTETRINEFSCKSPHADPATCRDDVQTYPLSRQTGMEMHFTMNYLNSHTYPVDEMLKKEVGSHEGPVCIIEVDLSPAWAGRPVKDCSEPTDSLTGDGKCTQTYNYGAQVIFDTTGNFGYFDPEMLALTLGAGIAYMAIPLTLISYLAFYFLGPVSNIYYRAGKQQVNLDHEVASLVARTIAMTQSFKRLSGDSDYLTQEALEREVEQVFNFAELSPREQRQLAGLVHWKLAHSQWDHVDYSHVREVDLKSFVSFSGNPMTVKDTVKLFDHERRLTVLERIFRPERQLRLRTRDLQKALVVKDGGPDVGAPIGDSGAVAPAAGTRQPPGEVFGSPAAHATELDPNP